MKRSSLKREKGAIFVEFAFALPVLFLAAFMGYEYSRLADLRLAKNDAVRTLVLGFKCASLQDDDTGNMTPAKFCYQEITNTLQGIMSHKFPNVEFAIQFFTLTDASNTIREGGCLNISGLMSQPIQRESFFIPPGFPLKYGSATLPPTPIVSNVFATGSFEALQLCMNNQVIVAELRLTRDPLFNIGNVFQPTEEHYEYAFL